MRLRCRNQRINAHSNSILHIVVCLFIVAIDIKSVFGLRKYTRQNLIKLREEVREMFQHAYDSYLIYASDYDELKPLTCEGANTWGSYSLTLTDSLDTLAVMGNFSEFRRVTDLLVNKSNFDSDINVSVFETNIRIVGGLLGAHLMQHRSGAVLEPGWPCNGPLLRLAEDVARRLLPAFDTQTGMPYGTVNLKYGVPVNETSVTCTAGIGTFIVEFGALSRLTGDPVYEEVAVNAIYALRKHVSHIGLYGNHIDVQTGRWTGVDSGIGAGVDSFFEYLVKGSIMLNRPELLHIFSEAKASIDKYLSKGDWHIWASMTKGQVTIPVFQSLDAYWPGVLSMIGDIPNAMKSIYNYHSVWKQYGFLPEFYNIPNTDAGANRESYPLRPELIESVMYLHRATGDPYLLEIGEDMLRSIQHSARTPCGFATIKNVRDHRKDNRMESFFLAETTKYLYLLFDPDNFLNNNGNSGTVVKQAHGECLLDTGGYIFNTEAHPIDPDALRCCYERPREQLVPVNFAPDDYLGEVMQMQQRIYSDVKTMPDPSDGRVTADKVSVIDDGTGQSIVQLSTADGHKGFVEVADDSAIGQSVANASELSVIDVVTEINQIVSAKLTNISQVLESGLDAVGEWLKSENAREELMRIIGTLEATTERNATAGASEADEIVGAGKAPTERPAEQIESSAIGSADAADESARQPAEPKIDWIAAVRPEEIFHETVDEEQAQPPGQFDVQRLIEKVRRMSNGTHTLRYYGSLSCRSQAYLQRLAIHGEILT